PSAPIASKTYWSRLSRDVVDHLVRSKSVELHVHRELKVYGRPGEDAAAFKLRCEAAAGTGADAEIAKLRDKYQAKATRLQTQLRNAEDRADIARDQASGRRNEELLSAASSLLGGLLGGKKSRGGLMGSLLGKASSAAGRRSRTS